MSTTPGATIPSPLLTPEHLTVIAAAFSSLVFFLVIVIMLSIIYRKDPQCCKKRSYQASHSDMASPPQSYSSRQTLVSSPSHMHIPDDNMQSGQLFYVGLPSSYSLEAPMPRLPSYESVRKKDHQRHIHKLIAERFGLSGSMPEEPPPSYEESVGRSVEVPHNSDQSCLDTADSHMSFFNGGFDNHEDPPAAPCDPSNGLSPL